MALAPAETREAKIPRPGTPYHRDVEPWIAYLAQFDYAELDDHDRALARDLTLTEIAEHRWELSNPDSGYRLGHAKGRVPGMAVVFDPLSALAGCLNKAEGETP
jgi:hypothetical protein